MRALVVWTTLLTALPALAETPVAVMSLEAKTGVDPRTAELLTDRITYEMSVRKDLRIIAPSEIKSMISLEQQKSLMGCTDDSCVAEIGAALGVEYLVSGSVGLLGESLLVNLSLVNIKTGQVVGRASEAITGGADKVLPLLPFMVGTLLQGIPGGPPPPPRPQTNPAAGSNSTGARSAAPATAGAATGQDEGGGSSSMPRRIVGGAVAGFGGVLLLGGIVLGAASLGYLVAARLNVGPLNTFPIRPIGGFGLAGGADLVGILGVLILGAGVVVAALP